MRVFISRNNNYNASIDEYETSNVTMALFYRKDRGSDLRRKYHIAHCEKKKAGNKN